MDRLIIHRHVFAREIYFPMEGGCQDPGSLSVSIKRSFFTFVSSFFL